MYGTKEEQIKLFETQLDLSEELRVPVIIHSRDADEDLVSIIKKRSFPYSGIMHCFSSSYDIAKAALDKGLYISFAGNVTYKSNNLIQQAAKYVPSDRILYETDSPYLAPVPMRYKPCNPCYSDYTSSFLADLRNKEADEFRSEAISNFKRLRSISEGTLKAARDYS